MNPFDILDSDFDISCFQTVDDDIVNQEIIKGILADTKHLNSYRHQTISPI